MYGGQCYGAFCDSMQKFAVAAHKAGTKLHFFPLFNESHVDRARNVCVDEFLKSGYSHLFFIDADIQFDPREALELADMDRDIVCGFYPKKQIAWKKVVEAVKLGWADKDPELLERFATELVYTPEPGDHGARSIYELTAVFEGGTGFMCIHRNVFDAIAKKNPWLSYHKTGPDSPKMTCFFDAGVTREPYARFVSEDYAFCQLARAAGFSIWLAPWVKLTHHGYYRWIGDIEALSKVALKEAA